jgi:diguanylate cyclase (GGDEF)-like protein/PAS domain S-box-containing protein
MSTAASEDLLRQILEANQAVQLLIDPETGRIVDANPAACRFYGQSRDELLARLITDINTVSQDQVRSAIERAASGQRNHFLFQHRLASGETRNVEVHSGPVDVRGRRLVFSIVHDITERKHVEEVLLRQSQAFAAALDGMAILGPDETYIYLNDAHVKMYGFERAEDLLGRSWKGLYAPDEASRFEREVMPTLWASGRWRGEAVGRRRDGSSFPQELSLNAIQGGGLVCVVRDITERKQGERLQSALFRIGEVTETAQEMNAFYAAIHAIVGDLMNARNFYIAIYDEAQRLLAFPYHVDQLDSTPAPAPLGRGLTEYVLRTGLPLLATPSVFERLQREGEVQLVGAPSLDWLGVPLKRGDRTFGVLAVQTYDETVRFAEAERDLLTFVSQHVAVAIDRKRAEEALRESETRFRALAETAPCAIVIFRGNDFRYANAEAAAVSGYSREELERMSFWDIVHPESRELAKERAIARHINGATPTHYELKIVRKDGEERWLDIRTGFIEYRGEDCSLATAFDITERKRAEKQIKTLAYHDALTELPNRLLFNDRLSLALAQAHRYKQKLAVLFLDLDHFKVINDSLGHGVGDRVLKETAARLQSCVREVDTVARVGGDEFILLLVGLHRPVEAARVAEKILHALRQPVNLEGQDLFANASMGIAVYPDDGPDVDTLVKNADVAMYRAKEHGRDRYLLYTPSLQTRALERLDRENRLRRAVAHQELRVHYQPLLDLKTGNIHGVEALLRWKHPERDEVLPASEFIEQAENIGLIVRLGPWVLRTACTQAREWHEQGHPALRVAVNLSMRQFLQPDLLAQIKSVLTETGLDARYLDLEITETNAMKDAEATMHTLTQLKALGVHISIDDFGIGYSSLSYLKRLPVDALKIDRSFVKSLPTDDSDAAIAKAVITLAHTLKLQVVAEGVETEAQRFFLSTQGCDHIQGRLFSEAIAPDRCRELLDRHRGS